MFEGRTFSGPINTSLPDCQIRPTSGVGAQQTLATVGSKTVLHARRPGVRNNYFLQPAELIIGYAARI